jgi:protein TonB
VLIELIFVALLQVPGQPQSAANTSPATVPIAANRLPWAQQPIVEYPERALSNNVTSGEVVLDCAVRPDGTLADCTLISEAPAEQSFGLVAMAGMRRARLDPNRWAEPRVTFRIGFVVRSR